MEKFLETFCLDVFTSDLEIKTKEYADKRYSSNKEKDEEVLLLY